MALHRRRGDDFTNSLNNFDTHKPLNTFAKDKCDLNKRINLFEGRNITNECMVQKNMEDSISQNKLNDHLFNKFDSVLFSLDSELNPMETNLTKQEVYRRLSEKYVSSPKKFTEKLITIIEESVINSTLNMSNNSIINFEKISKEIQRMCDNIEDESMPEQLLFTTIDTSPSKEISKIMVNNNPTQITNKKRCSEIPSSLSLNTDSCVIKTPSPTNMRRKVYRKTPRSIFKPGMKKLDIIPFSPSKYNDLSFESLEAQCEKLFPNEKKDRTSVQTIPNSTLLSMDHIFTICEQQLASLNSTDDDIEVISQKNKSSIKELQRRSKDINCSVYSKSENSACKNESKNKELKKTSDKAYEVDSKYIHYTDELDKTLLSELVQKRQRCLHTAKKMMEINSECNIMEVQKESKSKADCKSTLDVNLNKPQDNNDMFLNMLISCKDYHNYLENQLPMLNVSDSSKALSSDPHTNKSDKKNIDTNLTPSKKKVSTNKESNSKLRRSKLYTENYRKILARWNVDCANNEKKVEKATDKTKIFATPGKISAKDKRMQRVFFSDLHTTKKQRSPLKASINRSKQLSNINCNSTLSAYKRESIKSTLQVKNNQLSTKSTKSPLGKMSKLAVTHATSTKSLIRQNLLSPCKFSKHKDKENKIN